MKRRYTDTVLWTTLEQRFNGFKRYRLEITGRSMPWKIGGFSYEK